MIDGNEIWDALLIHHAVGLAYCVDTLEVVTWFRYIARSAYVALALVVMVTLSAPGLSGTTSLAGPSVGGVWLKGDHTHINHLRSYNWWLITWDVRVANWGHARKAERATETRVAIFVSPGKWYSEAEES